MNKIALLPGGFKPPHAGHYNMAKWLVDNTDAEKVVVKVGSKERDGISREMSLQLWTLYIQSDKDSSSGKISARASQSPSPVRDVYDFIETEAPEGSKVYLGLGEKDIEDKRYANIEKFAKPRNIDFETKLVPPQAGGVSGTEMRGFIKDGDKVSFYNSLPNHLSTEQKAEAWNIVYPATPNQKRPIDPRAVSQQLEEDLYNPKDKVNDYMRSSEYKAGKTKPDDIDPAYKYSRGGTYTHGGMYETRGGEPELHVYDFDETIARVETPIPFIIKSPEGKIIKKGETTSVNFEEKQKELYKTYNKKDIDFDFKAFEKQIGNAIINEPVYNKLLKSLGNPNVKTTVLTARSIGHPVTKYLKSIGLNVYVVPLGLQVGGKVTGQDKANWIDKRIKKSTKKVYFIDDSEDNREAVNFLKNKHPKVEFSIENPPPINLKLDEPEDVDEMMMGMMTEPEKKKHAKNLKRLSKDLKKQGNKYMKVPDYLKGTLTRKMYERDLKKGEERIAKSLPDKEFKKRYGKDWKAVKIATATKMAKKIKEGDTYEKMAAKGKKAGNLKQGTVRKRLRIKDGEKIPLSKITKAISSLKKRKSLNDKDKKYLKALNLAKTLKTTTNVKEGRKKKQDPKVGTGKKPKGSGRRLYTDENPSDTVSVKFSTRQDIVDTLSKSSFKSKPHKRQSQIINLIHQRVRAALSKAKDPAVKKRLKSGFEYIKKRKEASKRKTQQMKKENVFTKEWWNEQLNEILTETKANTHLTHLEELVLTEGKDGYNKAKSFLYELIKNLKGQSNKIKNVSVKWDGAPAIAAGIDPNDGQFFVGTKAVFGVTPKLNKSDRDIEENHKNVKRGDEVQDKSGLRDKLKLALRHLRGIGITNILQGDLMFTSETVNTEDIDGVAHYTFKPNTIRYAVESNSEIGKKINEAEIGIIFHTSYDQVGKEAPATFGADISGLKGSKNVWFDDAYFKDDTGVLLNEKEEQFILNKIKEADSINVNYEALPEDISDRAKTNLLNTYLNTEIRKGEFVTDPNKSFEMFKEWYQERIEKAVLKVKDQEKKRKQLEDKLKSFENAKNIVLDLFKVSKLLSEAKSIFITKYDKAVATKHFVDNEDGTLRVTKAEGFVAVDHTENGIKLVDRLEFSKNNFNAGKPGS
jgi:hypothetical protein